MLMAVSEFIPIKLMYYSVVISNSQWFAFNLKQKRFNFAFDS